MAYDSFDYIFYESFTTVVKVIEVKNMQSIIYYCIRKDEECANTKEK